MAGGLPEKGKDKNKPTKWNQFTVFLSSHLRGESCLLSRLRAALLSCLSDVCLVSLSLSLSLALSVVVVASLSAGTVFLSLAFLSLTLPAGGGGRGGGVAGLLSCRIVLKGNV